MLHWIVDFLESIGNLVVSLLGLIIDVFSAFISLLINLPSYINYAGFVFNLVPPFVLSFFLIVFSISIIYFIKEHTM